MKIEFFTHLSIDLNFRHTSKKIKGGSLKKFLEKKMFSPKSMSNLGRLTVYSYLYLKFRRMQNKIKIFGLLAKQLDILPTQSLCLFVIKTMSKIGSMYILEIYCQ